MTIQRFPARDFEAGPDPPSAGALRERRRSRVVLAAASMVVFGACVSGSAPGPDRQQDADPSPGTSCGPAPEAEARCVGRLVPRNLTESYTARMSPDGRYFVFPAVRGRNVQLRLLDRRSGTTEWLTRGPGERHDPVWSPDGTRVAFAGEVPGVLSDMARGIGVVDVRTGEERLVFRETADFLLETPSWTPEGRIVFERDPITIGPVTPDASEPAPRSGRDGEPGGPARPPGVVPSEAGGDARAGAVRRRPGRGRAGRRSGGMWIMDADGLDPRPYHTPASGRIAFSPAGDRIAWTGDRCRPEDDAARVLCVAGRDGEDARRVLTAGDEVAGFGWAPDGETLHYAGSTVEDGTARLYAVDASGEGRPRRLATPEGRITGMSVARSGEVALSIHRPDVGVATVPATGGVPERIPLPDSVHGFWPAWRPDGERIGFTATPWPPRAFWREAEFAVVDPGRRRASVPLRRPGARGVRTVTGVWSPDGELFASYQLPGRRGGGFRLGPASRMDSVVADLGPADWRVVPSRPDWSPEGDRIVIAPGGSRHQRGISEYLPRYGLVEIEVDSALLAGASFRGEQSKSAVRLEGFPGTAQQPRYAPGGERIAFSRRVAAGDSSGVHVVPAGGGAVETVAELETGEMLSGPEWGPGGRSLYYARPDRDGVHRVYRSREERAAGRGWGEAEPVTRGPTHALHPRLSPDGETLAVTLWEPPTELWVLPSRTPEAAPPPVDTAPPDPRVGTTPLDSVRPGLRQLVVRAEAAGAEVRGLWPGFWDAGRTYAVRAPGEPREALAVTPGLRPAGYRPVDPGDLPSALEGRLYHATGPPARLHWLDVDVPVHDAARDSTADRRELEERLFGLYRVVMQGRGLQRDTTRDRGPDGDAPRRPYECRVRSGCDGEFCTAVVRAEHRMLRRAASDVRWMGDHRIEGEELERRIRSIAAVRWMRTLTDSREPSVERRSGVSAWVARQAALLAVGRDTAIYRPGAIPYARLAGPDEPLPDMRERAAATGQVIAELLDELGPGWRRRVRAGATLVEAMFEMSGLSEARAPVVATRAMRDQFALESRLREQSGPGYYKRALCNLAPPVRRIEIRFPSSHPLDGGRWGLRWEAGETGVANPVPGWVFLPRPERFVLEIPGVRAVVRGQPVAVVQESGGVRPSTQVVIYPSRDLGGRLRQQQSPETGGVGPDEGERGEQELRGGGVELRLGPQVDVVEWESRIDIRP